MKKVLAYMQLLRLPNVFTAMADIFMGFLISHGSFERWGSFLLLLLASSSIYLAGMVLNDWFDVEVDRRERPQRPLPSGRVPRSHALWVAIGLLVIGLAAATIAGSTSFYVALVLITAVIAYDGLMKSTLLGPAIMGLCRALNVLLGMSTQSEAIWLFDTGQPPAWRFGTMVAAGVGLYIMGVTRFARREATGGGRVELASSTLGFNLGLLLIALATRSMDSVNTLMPGSEVPFWLVNDAPKFSLGLRFSCAAAIWMVVVVITNVAVWRAVERADPRSIQQAVKTCILSLIALDASVVAFVLGPIWAAAVLALLVPTLVLGRWVYST